MTSSLERRARQVRSRAAVRAWEYRQRRHAKGAWGRFRRLLALSSEAYAVPESSARRLRREGYQPDPAGLQLEPPKTILTVPAERLPDLEGASRVPVRLCRELLAARHLVLLPFPRRAEETHDPQS